LNAVIKKDHFLLPFLDKMLERLVGHSCYCFLDAYSGYIISLLFLRIRRRLLSHVRLGHMPLRECLLDSAMPLLLFGDA